MQPTSQSEPTNDPEMAFMPRKRFYGSPTICERVLIFLSYIVVAIVPIFWLCICRAIPHYERIVIFRLGRVLPSSPKGPGIIFFNPLVDKLLACDIRTESMELPAQEVLTKDSVTVSLEAVVYYKIKSPVITVLNITEYETATYLLAVSILRNIVGQYTLSDVLSGRGVIKENLRKELDAGSSNYGIHVEKVEIKEVKLPGDLQVAMAVEAEGKRIAKAQIITARGEIKAAENLRDAGRLMSSNPKIMLLRYLQTLSYISTDRKASILFPFPIEMPKNE